MLDATLLLNLPIPVSTLCLGTANWGEARGSAPAALYESFRTKGGNFFDTAHCYAFWRGQLGVPERVLGELVRRDRRDEVVIATKGGHNAYPGYPRPDAHQSPELIASDLRDSLERLCLDHVDLYYLHRDDERVPVGEAIDALAEHVTAGRVRALGASNWSAARIAAANAYAAANGKPGFVVSQPMWNLAHVSDAPGGDATLLHLNDRAGELAWYRETKFPIAAYTPTAGGIFDDEAKPLGRFDHPATIARRTRAATLAKTLGVTPGQIALAWLRHAAPAVIPIVGTMDLDHLDQAIAAMAIALTPDQVDALSGPLSSVVGGES